MNLFLGGSTCAITQESVFFFRERRPPDRRCTARMLSMPVLHAIWRREADAVNSDQL
jgi:hypothetical protein